MAAACPVHGPDTLTYPWRQRTSHQRRHLIAVSVSAVVLAWAALCCAQGAGAEAVRSIRGVGPTEEAKYMASAAAGTFHCFSEGSQEGSRSAPLTFSAVNDDFCDCSDGSDEPGTGACAGQKETLFYCPNDQSLASYVYASRVNDGICDCCDGSDEFRTGGCPNTCEKEGVELRRQMTKKQAEWDRGVAERESLMQYAKRAREKAEKELAELQEKLPGLEADENATGIELQEVERDQELLKAADGEIGQVLTEEDHTDPTAKQANEESQKDLAESTEASEEMAEEKADEAPAGEAAEDLSVEGDKNGKLDKGGAAAVSEYTKWMDGAEKVLPAETPEVKVSEPVEETTQDEEKEENLSVFASIWKALLTQWERIFGKSMTPLERAHYDAEKAHDAAKEALKDVQAQIEELQRKAKRKSDDDSLAYDNLDGKCLSKKWSEYTYEACFFKNAKQDSVSLGSWEKWESTHVALFDDGDTCPGGIARSLRVIFECGATEEILEVGEPSRCTYEAKATHPGACIGAGPAEAYSKARMPTEEL